MTEIKPSVCPYDCPDCCGLLITVEDGKAVCVAGDPEHAFTRGTLCPKMAHYERTVHSAKRIMTPLKRVGQKGEGRFSPIGWDEAIEEIARRWHGIIKEYGAEAILPYSYAGTMGTIGYSAGHALFYALGATSLDRTICAPAKSRGYRDVMGATLPTAPQEAQHSDMIVLWSISMLATDIHFRHDIEMARKRGAKVYCIDTYRTKTADYADAFLCPRPGTDGALALAILHVLVQDDLADRAFLKEYVQGADELEQKVLPHYTLEAAAAITGVPAAAIRAFAHAYGNARAPFIRLGSGQSRYVNGAMTSRLITCLPAFVGAYAKKGGGLLTSASGSHAFDKNIIRRPDLEQRGVRHINMCELGRALNDPDLTPPVKALYIYSSNPACTAPDQNQVLRGLQREDLFTVVHERFLTDTTRYADIVLPATTSLESEDLYYSYGHYTIQRARAVIPPVGESKSNWQTARLLAKAMHLTDPIFAKTEEDLVEALIASTKKAWPLPLTGEALQRLRDCHPVDLPLPADYKLHFATPSGKIEIKNPRCQPPLPDYLPPHKNSEPFHLINAPDMRILDSSFNERDELTRDGIMTLLIHPEDAAARGLQDGDSVRARNQRGHAHFTLKLSDCVNRGTLVTEGVWWQAYTKDGNTNRLTSMRLTDKDGGSTFYDVSIDIEKA
ncbi:molybdopterin-dependent oxidoreductase [Mitsuokella multacida]|uniref:molybdopterin-dependent oxidoreductase n=1 Tax=Mitsuokella multacida TaxID=52226 RepID=UPI001F1A15F1|nr:molybdopterin-dependent oxidoreductase [Mitsuokella multacida]MCF2584793.1 molybdopterin-dependent oxidoreductase [Mitsuokella multacida]